MTGNEAAQVVADLCKRKRHNATTTGTTEPTVCADCWELMEALRAKHRDDTPPLPTVSVHLVLDDTGKVIASGFDETLAAERAHSAAGVLVSLPAAADYRTDHAGQQAQYGRRP